MRTSTARRLGARVSRPIVRRGLSLAFATLLAISANIPPVNQVVAPLTGALVPAIPAAAAVGTPCSNYSDSYPLLTGWLSNSAGTKLTTTTTGSVYGRVSNVDQSWDLTHCHAYRYDAVLWATTNDTTHLRVDWGLLAGDGNPCRFLPGTADYLHANTGACPGSPTTARLIVALTPEAIYHNDSALNNKGDFAFAHSDCYTRYAAEVVVTGATTAVTTGRPGVNCGNKALDGSGITQALVYDGTGPTAAATGQGTNGITIGLGNPAVVASTSVTLYLGATDLVSGVSEMQFSNDNVSWSTPQAYAATASWTLTAGDGAKSVSVKFNDALGNASAVYSDTVTLDTTSPIAAVATPEVNRPVAGDVSVTGTAADASSFLDYTLDYGAGSAPTSWTTITTSTTQVPTSGPLGTWSTGTLAAGPYTLRLTVRDVAGNSSAVDSHLLYVDNTRRGDESYLTRVPFDLGGGWGLDVGVASGEARLTRSLFSIPSYGPPAGLDLAYSSVDLATAGPFGSGWSSNLTQSLSFESGFVVWHRADGGRVPFGQVGAAWTPLTGHFETLTRGASEDTITLKDQTRLVFENTSAGRLKRIENRFGTSLGISWGTGSATLTDASSRPATITFTGSLITSVLDSAGRTWTFGYTGSDLSSITEPDPDGAGPLAAPVTALAYASHQLTTITRSRRTAAGGSDTITWTVGYTVGKATSVIDPIAHAAYADVANTFTYNAGSTDVGLLKTYSPVMRNTTTYAYDAWGRATTITDALSQQTTLAWNDDSTLQSVTLPIDASTTATTTYSYDARGNVLTETADALGSPTTTRYVYNASNDVTETHVADGTADEVVTTQAYDTTGVGGTPGHLVTVTRNSGGPTPEVTGYAYTASDQVAAELDPKGITTTHAYDANGNETQSVANCTNTGTTPPGDPAWKTCAATGTHDATTNVTTTSVFTLTATAGRLGLPDNTTSALTGRSTTFAYDTLGRPTSETPPEGATSHEWDELGNEIRTTQPGSLVTTRTLDLANHVTTEVAPGPRTTTTYDATGAVVSTTVAGDTVSRTYDGAGQLLTETIDPGTTPHLNLVTEHAYDASGREIAARDPAGTVRRTWYDNDGRVTQVVENCTNTGTTIPGDPAWKTCAGSGTHDATWNLTTTPTYDARGNRLTEVAPNGRLTTFTYDDLDRLTKQVANDVATPTLPTQDVTTEYAFDANGRQTAVRSPTNTGGTTVTRTLYDNLGRVVQTIANCTDTTPPANWWECAGTATPNASTNVVTVMTYDADGHRLSVTGPDPSATTGSNTVTVTTRYAFDGAGRLCRVLENASVDLQTLAIPCTTAVTGTATSNVSTRYTYDTAGNLASMVDGRGNTTAYGYDAQGRMTSLTDATTGNHLWAYDDVAHTKTQTNPTSPGTTAIAWTHDAAGRVITRAYLDDAGAARTTGYTYTSTGALATAVDGTSTITITSDRLGRPTSVAVTSDTAATTTYGYSFTAPTRTDASGATTMAVDPFGHLTSLTDPIHANSFTWAYGADGQVVTAVAPNANSTAFTYDPLGRLLTTVTGTRASYTSTYNRAGGRLTEASTITGDPGNGTATTGYDPLDRLINYSLPGIRTIADTWQAVPSRDTQTLDGVPSAQGFDAANRPNTNSYTYDADGRMTARPGSSGGALEWDSLGRLVRVRATPGGTIIATYAYDALDRLLTVERSGSRIRFRYAGTTTAVAGVVDDIGGTVIRNVATGPDGTVLLDWLGTSRRLYGVNGHHDTTWTSDDTGAVTATARYDPWGNIVRSSGTLPDWRFQGSWADTTTNLAWAVARWYDPVQGTFISEDTLLGSPENPGSRHLYAYGAGDPVGSWDPDGRDAILGVAQFFKWATPGGSVAGNPANWTMDVSSQQWSPEVVAHVLTASPMRRLNQNYQGWKLTVRADDLLLAGSHDNALGITRLKAKITVTVTRFRAGRASTLATVQVLDDWHSSAGAFGSAGELVGVGGGFGDFFRIGPWHNSLTRPFRVCHSVGFGTTWCDRLDSGDLRAGDSVIVLTHFVVSSLSNGFGRGTARLAITNYRARLEKLSNW